MKKSLLFLLLAVAVAACNRSSGIAPLTWDSDTLLRFGEYDVVGLIYPVAHGGAAADSINGTITASLRDFFAGADFTSYTLSDAIDTLLARKDRDSLTHRLGYRMQAEAAVYTRGALTSVLLLSDAYTGGAHGISSGRFFNFDNRTGELLGREKLFGDTMRLAALNRIAFDRHAMSGFGDDEFSYLFYDPDSIPLPENIGFDTTGVCMLYNPYEIAAYALGSIRYSIPYSEVETILERIVQKQ